MGSSFKIARLKQIHSVNRHHADLYCGRWDRAKTFLLRWASTHARVAALLSPLNMLTVRMKGIGGRVYLRVRGSDFLVLREIFEMGEYEGVHRWNLPADARIFDLGGNIGLASLFFSSLAPAARVLIVKPDEDNCRMIARNCRQMVQANRLQIVRGFVAAKDGVAGLDRDRRAWAFFKTDRIDENHVPVPCHGMVGLIEQSGFDVIDLLKCDVEGSEREIFAECKPWIGRVRRLAIEVHHPYALADLYADLRAAGWEFAITQEHQEARHGVAMLTQT